MFLKCKDKTNFFNPQSKNQKKFINLVSKGNQQTSKPEQ